MANEITSLASAKRRYDLDWLRVIAFLILIFFHVGMFFNYWGWHIKNNEQSTLIQIPMYFSSQWRMSLLFMISGAGIYYALGSRTPGAFARERLIRIFLPLMFGMFVIVPPQIYIERITQGEMYSYLDFYKTVFNFQPYPEGNFSWHHLWYLVYIFVYSLVGLPVFLFLRRSYNATRFLAGYFSNPLWLVMVPVVIHGIGTYFLAPHFPATNDLIHDWNQHFHYFLLFLSGFIFCSQQLFWETMQRYRYLMLGIWIVLTPVVYYYYFEDVELSGAERLFYIAVRTMNAWTILLCFFGFAYRYLRFTNRFLKYANEAVYPFYILHQTVIILLAYPIMNLAVSPVIKFIYLSIATFLGCFLLYHFMIRKTGVLRILFGLKAEKRREEAPRIISSIS